MEDSEIIRAEVKKWKTISIILLIFVFALVIFYEYGLNIEKQNTKAYCLIFNELANVTNQCSDLVKILNPDLGNITKLSGFDCDV